MNAVDWQRIKDLFSDALEQPAESREQFIRNACGTDNDLYREVISLLAASSESENLIENNSIDLAGKIGARENTIPEQHFGNYRIIREIGSGGMGTVFLAERDDGELVMQVALKIVRQSVADREIIARFKMERQILADLRHPNIAVLLDGGLSDKGEPYLAMEYIDGRTLVDHANTHDLSIAERLQLFIKVCSAVAFAHRNLIVHRDIKPSNILVGTDGEPKLLDFGLAKSFGSVDTQIQTTIRAFTPAYASPEQITGRSITTASDIYSLGVILYELLTGAKPLVLEDKSFEEIVQTINTSVPRPPSESAPSMLSANRKLRGDLDNIILMALRKEPERRYRSVEDLADDLQNHLDNRPVTARPNTLSYRASRFIVRNKIAVAAGILVFISVLAGIGVSLWQADAARREAARSQTVNEFLKKMLMTAMPESRSLAKRGEQASIVDVLYDVEKRLDEGLASEPEVRSQLRQIIGDAFLAQGRYTEAERNLTQAFAEQSSIFGGDSLATVRSEISLASLFFAKADYDRSIEIFDRRYTPLKAGFKAGQVDPSFYLSRLTDYATICRARGDAAKAEQLLSEAIAESDAIGVSGLADSAKVILNLILLDQGRFAEAQTNQLEIVERYRSSLTPDDPLLAQALTLLGSIQMENGDLKNAKANLSEAETIYYKSYGPDYLPIHDNVRLQAQVAYLMSDHELAQRQIEKVFVGYRKISSPKYISFATALTINGLTLSKLGKTAEAESSLREALALRLENLPPGHFMTALTKGALGEILLDQKRYNEAEPFIRESLESLSLSQKTENNRVTLARERLDRLQARQ